MVVSGAPVAVSTAVASVVTSAARPLSSTSVTRGVTVARPDGGSGACSRKACSACTSRVGS